MHGKVYDYGFNIRDLRRVIAVAEHRSLRQAALALEVDQGTLTRSIQALEHALRIPLFERMRTGAQLTAAGVAFTKIAASVLDGMDEAMLHLRLRHNGVVGRLRLGVQVSFGNGVVANLLERYQTVCPDVDLQIMDGPREILLRDVAASRLDAAIVIAGEGWAARGVPLGPERVLVAIARDHPLAARAAVMWPGLSHCLLTLPRRGAGMELRKLVLLHGILPERIIFHDAAIDRLLALVRHGDKILLVTEGATGIRMDGVVFRPIMDESGPTTVDLTLCWRDGESDPVLARFIELARHHHEDDVSVPGVGGV
ncbi:transcriptional regulator, LysR family [Gluconacetobacter diazotrophicus PA1 5]|nr:LysR family transcriptional regulator [Gluconacetobacter diazotrophicus]ACI51451.1 transcriptional regulator, LysR family [Gluconacetobacter diazotrophicus PA1 5]TWA98099.1 DNA-binding transcriptional LysR family regulator [Gluconacetobacter diazotrophicus]